LSIHQLNFEGKNKVEVAIDRLRYFEPPEGYYLAFSGGKDSVTILKLAKLAKVNYDAHYNLTTVDPPEIVSFIKSTPEIQIEKPPNTMWQLVYENGLPRRQGRWCCRELKERGGSGRFVITGVRKAESKGSTMRAHRGMVETCYKDTSKRFMNPIIDWEDGDVWEFIREYDVGYCLLYDEGFERLGCVLCPMVREIKRQQERWSKICDAWYRATVRYWNRQTKGGQRFESADALWEWWLDRDRSSQPDEQLQFYD